MPSIQAPPPVALTQSVIVGHDGGVVNPMGEHNKRKVCRIQANENSATSNEKVMCSAGARWGERSGERGSSGKVCMNDHLLRTTAYCCCHFLFVVYIIKWLRNECPLSVRLRDITSELPGTQNQGSGALPEASATSNIGCNVSSQHLPRRREGRGLFRCYSL